MKSPFCSGSFGVLVALVGPAVLVILLVLVIMKLQIVLIVLILVKFY